jgi:hypothetical protein
MLVEWEYKGAECRIRLTEKVFGRIEAYDAFLLSTSGGTTAFSDQPSGMI